MRQLTMFLAVLLVSCQREPAGEVAHLAKTATPPPAAATQASGAVTGGMVLTAADGSQIAVQRTGQNIEIRYAGGVLIGEPRDSGKRKYRLGNGPVTYEVKPNENGFKLRTADGALRWKVKISAEKIKISDNEENKNPFELKKREGGRVKVVGPGEREIGSVQGSPAHGVMLLDSISQVERYILAGELLSREP